MEWVLSEGNLEEKYCGAVERNSDLGWIGVN